MSTGGLSASRLRRLHEAMAGYVERGHTSGVVTLVSRRGEVHVDAIGSLAFGGAEPMRRDTIFRIASMTKPVTAAAAMILVEECRLRLDDPVDGLLPELAGRRVLRRLDGPLGDTVAAVRPITVRDLLTFRMGLGALMAPAGRYPIQDAMVEAGVAPGVDSPPLTPGEYMKRLGALPLAEQPGEAWMYHTGSDVLGVLISRAAGQPLADFLAERLFEPLGMKDTAFHVPPGKLGRLPASYVTAGPGEEVAVHDDPASSRFATPPVFPSGGAGLVSTADDYLAFCRMMLAKGRAPGGRILSRPSVELMTMDHLTAQQKAEAPVFFGGDSRGWGFGLAVVTRRDHLSAVPGRFGWDGGAGTSAYCDPAEDLAGILLTQRLLDSAPPNPMFGDFWTSVYQAIDD